jgi:hypothetical protein
MMRMLRWAASVACLGAFVAGFAVVWPNARDAAAILLSQDDPALLSQLQIAKAVAGDPKLVEREIVAALKDGDVDLAQSFAHLALAQDLPVSMELLARSTRQRHASVR